MSGPCSPILQRTVTVMNDDEKIIEAVPLLYQVPHKVEHKMVKCEKYVYIRTFGCQMNVHDSEQMAMLLRESGYGVTEEISEADLIIINTCSVREKAEQKAHSYLGRLRRLTQRKRGLIIGIAGCLAQQWGRDFLRKIPHLDFVLGTHNIDRLPEIVERIEQTRERIVATDFRESVTSTGICVIPRNGTFSAYVTIMQGCNNFCSYCIVPYLRGREESRRSDDIIDEIQRLAHHGIREVTLLGQNVNSYGNTDGSEVGFPELLHMVNDIEDIDRIRFTTSHPKDLSEELMKCFASLEKLCEHIHLPVQSGSAGILKRMNRGYSPSDYLEKVERLRHWCPDISITSDIIVGFPGESDEDFQKTIDLMEKVRFDNTFSFAYSDRPGIAAEVFPDKVSDEVRNHRLRFLQSVQNEHTIQSNLRMVGREEEVFIEGASRNRKTDVMGRTRSNKIVNVPGEVTLKGSFVRTRITKAYAHSLRGRILSERED